MNQILFGIYIKTIKMLLLFPHEINNDYTKRSFRAYLILFYLLYIGIFLFPSSIAAKILAAFASPIPFIFFNSSKVTYSKFEIFPTLFNNSKESSITLFSLVPEEIKMANNSLVDNSFASFVINFSLGRSLFGIFFYFHVLPFFLHRKRNFGLFLSILLYSLLFPFSKFLLF